MNILSLFDGMSCGQIALNELGIHIDAYYASEIDKFAIKQTQHNFPNTIQLGDVEKWQEWQIDWKGIDLVLAGSPCQGFSFAGKQLAFNDPRSKLFFVFIDILNHLKKCNPDIKFLLENVDMKRSHMKVISDYCGVFPANINSNLVSAQNRNRWYWTNIRTKQIGLFGEIHSDISQPKDRGILLRDILETDVDEKYYLSDKGLAYLISHKENNQNKGNGFGASYSDGSGKCNTLLSRYYKDGKEQLIIQRARGFNKGGLHKDKSPTLSTCSWQQNNLLADECRVRKLTPKEVSRLQTIPEKYEWIVSDTQIYRMCGNGWTVEVIKHILKELKKQLHGHKTIQ